MNLGAIRKAYSGKLIFTCRNFQEDSQTVKSLYHKALEEGFDYVDVDIEFMPELSQIDQDFSSKLILSFHNYADSRLSYVMLDRMFQIPAAHYKIGLHVTDVWETFALLKSSKSWEKPVLLVLMGEAGEWSRVCYRYFDNPWTYLCDMGVPTAPGQVDTQRWDREFGRVPSKKYDLYGILGGQVSHSFSPYFHNQFFKKRKKSCSYQRFPAQDLENFFDLCPPWIKGLSVTTPLKRSVVPFLSSYDYLVEASGSCNTMVRDGTAWIGHNTDASGLRAALDEIMPGWVEKEKVIILGAGGLARSALAALCDHKEMIFVWNRTEYKARDLAEQFGVNFLPTDQRFELRNTVLIQATSAGFQDQHVSPIPPEWLEETTTLVESIYNPRYTLLATRAMEMEIEILQAVDLFRYQAIHQQRIWFGDLGFSVEEGQKVLS
jgi:shikimate dehydrogenase